MKTGSLGKIRIVFVIAFFATFPVFSQDESGPITDIPPWHPPKARLKAKTPFAPKPVAGNNIFKGEREGWLADAIVELETGGLKPIADSAVSDYVSQVGLNLAAYSVAPKKKFEFVVVDDEHENAMNIGAGRVFITLGLLRSLESEDELAGILAHEIGHDVFMHAPKTVTRQMFWMIGKTKVSTYEEVESSLAQLLRAYDKNSFAMIGENLLGWSRFDELQADKAGFYNMYKAGYNPEALKNVFKRFVRAIKEKLGDGYAADWFLTLLFGSHPPTSQRVTALKWESNWIKMPPKEEQYRNAAFAAIKARLSKA